MSWNLKGSYVETCSCDLICPCNATFDHGATYDFCRALLVFNIREGEIEGTDIAGLKVAAIADTPKVMTDGNWRLGMFIDERATDEQAGKLTQVFGGQLGGRHRARTRHGRPQAQPVTEHDQRPGDGHAKVAEHLPDRLFHLLLVDSHQGLLPFRELALMA